MTVLEPHGEGVVLPVRARGGARSDGLQVGPDGVLKITVTQAPERGKANRAIAALLSRRLKLRKSQIELLAGRTVSRKKFLVRALTAAELQSRIEAALGDTP